MQEAEDRLTKCAPHDTALGHDCPWTGLQLTVTRTEQASRVSNGLIENYAGDGGDWYQSAGIRPKLSRRASV
jgi:hypothetical protein